jgi:hypothetical protein
VRLRHLVFILVIILILFILRPRQVWAEVKRIHRQWDLLLYLLVTVIIVYLALWSLLYRWRRNLRMAILTLLSFKNPECFFCAFLRTDVVVRVDDDSFFVDDEVTSDDPHVLTSVHLFLTPRPIRFSNRMVFIH